MAAWYYKFSGQRVGPVSLTEIKILIASGQLSSDTSVRYGGDGAWRSVASTFLRTSDGALELREPVIAEPDMSSSAEAPTALVSPARQQPGTSGIADDADTGVYIDDRDRTIKSVKLAGAFVAGFIGIGLYFHAELVPFSMVAYCLAAVVGLKGINTSRRLLNNEPVFTMNSDGFTLPSWSRDAVPWQIVRDAERIRSKHSDALIFHIDRRAARNLSQTGFRGVLQRSVGWSSANPTLILSNINGNADILIAKANSFLAKSGVHRAPEFGDRNKDEVEIDSDAFKSRRLTMTYILMVVLACIYACEVAFGVEPLVKGEPTLTTLLVFGGTFRDSVFVDGQWWRLFTAPLLHANLLHLVFNLIALWFAGKLLERLIGLGWFLAIFFISALGGSIASLWLNPPNIIGVGASGGIVGLFAALIVASFRFPSGGTRTQLQISALRVLIPSLLPLIGAGADGEQIDYASHAGGAVAGCVAMLLILKLWPSPASFPRSGRAATIFNGAFAAIVILALLPIALVRHELVANPFRDFFAGRYQQAASSFAAKSEEDGAPTPYYRLWRYIAQTRGADPAALRNLRTAADASPKEWPRPIFLMFLGDATEESVAAQAANSDQKCEATFYAGEWYLMRGMPNEARDRFSVALASCPKTFMEYDGARGELEVMAGLKRPLP